MPIIGSGSELCTDENKCLTISTEWVYSLCVGDGCENARKGGPSGSGKDLSITDISKSQWLKEFDNGILCTAHDLQRGKWQKV